MSSPEILAVQFAKSTTLVSEKAAGRGHFSAGGTRTGWAGQLFVACIDLLAVATLLGLGWLFGFAVGISTEALPIPLLAAATFLFCSFLSGQTYSPVRRHPVAGRRGGRAFPGWRATGSDRCRGRWFRRAHDRPPGCAVPARGRNPSLSVACPFLPWHAAGWTRGDAHIITYRFWNK